MGIPFDKWMHFAVGIVVGMSFWWGLERYGRLGARLVNPIVFLVMLIWGASGLFFFRTLHIPLLDHTYFYMAIPDWDIPLQRWTKLPLLIHRSWLFHSVLTPFALLGLWLWLRQRQELGQKLRSQLNLLRDAALGLSVGICAHLIWDALLSSTRRGFYIHGFSRWASALWLFVNLLVGLGLPFLLAQSLQDER